MHVFNPVGSHHYVLGDQKNSFLKIIVLLAYLFDGGQA